MFVFLHAVLVTVLISLLIGRIQLLERLLLSHLLNLTTVSNVLGVPDSSLRVLKPDCLDFNILHRVLAETRLLVVVLRVIFLVLLGFSCYTLLGALF
ncbi:non-structural protein 7a [Feline coronavirus UU17]|uniref:Non-structural protein 7a n=1 Tax=Feline coronavirus UU17 TaxID=871678 RepID=E0AGV1_9ALPC|nr:non-structural protein 7a [Feline coronavirus UU17]